MPLQDTTPQKTCTKCGETKPATAEYFARFKHARDGFCPRCKTCDRIYRVANRDRRNEQSRTWHHANREHDKEYRRVYNEVNKERRAATFRAWYVANQEYAKSRVRDYYAANQERRVQYSRTYREENRGRAIEYMRQYNAANKQYFSEYYIANKAAHKVSIHRRRARERNAEGTHTAKDVAAQFERQKGHCYYCSVKVGDTYHLDHIVPLSRGGTNWPENLVIACQHCNLSKGDKLPHEWVQCGRLL